MLRSISAATYTTSDNLQLDFAANSVSAVTYTASNGLQLHFPANFDNNRKIIAVIGHYWSPPGTGNPDWEKMKSDLGIAEFQHIGKGQEIRGASDGQAIAKKIVAALNDIAGKSSHPELKEAGLIWHGCSRHGASALYTGLGMPERTIAVVNYHSNATHRFLTEYPNISSLKSTFTFPVIFTVNSNDNERVQNLFTDLKLVRSKLNALATYALQPVARCDKHCSSTCDELYVTHWLREVIKVRVNQEDNSLNRLKLSQGWLGSFTLGKGDGTAPYLLSNQLQNTQIQPASHDLDNPATFSWFPTEASASAWVNFSANGTISQSYLPLSVYTSSLPEAEVEKSYSVNLVPEGGEKPYSWEITTGLPPGLTLQSATGVLSGTPTTPGVTNITVKLTDNKNTSVTRQLTLAVLDVQLNTVPEITSQSIPDAVKGQPFSFKLAAEKGNGTLSWSLVSGNLLNGITLSKDGLLSGTTVDVDTRSFAIKVTDKDGDADTQSFRHTSLVEDMGIKQNPQDTTGGLNSFWIKLSKLLHSLKVLLS